MLLADQSTLLVNIQIFTLPIGVLTVILFFFVDEDNPCQRHLFRKRLVKDTYPIKINSLNSLQSSIMGVSNEKSNTSAVARVI